ncbi:MAG: Gfo/Idh/MocA family oxidoreductase [Nocardioidaceae bacterium]
MPLMSVWRNFFLGNEPLTPFKTLDARKARDTCREELLNMGIDIRDLEQPVGTLSGGERQAVAIARAVYFGAKVLILDEPTSALGVKQSGVVLKYIRQAKSRGVAVVFITHNPHHAFMVGDRFYLLNRGRLTNEFVKDPSAARSWCRRWPAAPSSRRSPTSSNPTTRPAPPADDTTREREEMDTLKVGIIGAGWMGHVHARAYQRLAQHWPDLPRSCEIVAVADSSEPAAAAFARSHGDMAQHADWRDLLADPSVEAVSVTAPNFLHSEIGVAVAAAGKHLWIEKPVGLRAADALAVRDAVASAGVVGCVGFNYRNVPAVARARRLVESGAIGTPTHARVQLLTDYAAHPGSPLSWRYAVDRGGHGVLGDLASHGVDLLRFVLGDIAAITAQTAVHIPQRPIAEGAQGHYSFLDLDQPGLRFGTVENEDYVIALLRMRSGALTVCEANRAAGGSRTTTPSRCTAPRACCAGTSVAPASCRSPPAPSTPDSRPPPCSASRVTGSTPRSSRARASPWATTTPRSSRPRTSSGRSRGRSRRSWRRSTTPWPAPPRSTRW